MSKVHGRLSTFTWNSIAVNGLEDINVTLERSEVDVTTKDTGDGFEFLDGRLSCVLDMTGKWNEADAGQSAMLDDHFTPTDRAIVVRMSVGSGIHEFTGTGKITNFSPGSPNQGGINLSTRVRFNGTVTKATQ